jgi:predicted nucleotidyltransferase
MRPEERLSKRIEEAGETLADALGERIVCVALYGSAAGDEFSPDRSDVNLLLVLREVAFEDLRLIGTTLAREAERHGIGFATPLVVDREFLRAARDSFPIELEDIRSRHRVLAGEDVLAGLSVPTAPLRLAAERELRTLSLRLHALALHRPEDAAIHDAVSHLAASFSVVGAALLELPRGGPRPRRQALTTAVGERLGLELPFLARVLETRDGARGWPAGPDLDRLLASLVRELDAAVRAIDRREVRRA